MSRQVRTALGRAAQTQLVRAAARIGFLRIGGRWSQTWTELDERWSREAASLITDAALLWEERKRQQREAYLASLVECVECLGHGYSFVGDTDETIDCVPCEGTGKRER